MTRISDADNLTQELAENDALDLGYKAPPEAPEGKTWTLLVHVVYPDAPLKESAR